MNRHYCSIQASKATIDFAYACVVTIRDVAVGERFTVDNIWVKRPGSGIPSYELPNVVGKHAARDIPSNYLIKYEDIA